MLGGLLDGGRRQARNQARRQQQTQQQGMGILGNLLNADGDRNTMDDILAMAMKNMIK